MEQQIQTETQCFENHGQDSRVREIEVAPTINAKAGTGGNNLPLTVECLNPEDAQSARIYSEDGAMHSLNANSNGGQSRDGVLCCHGSQDPLVNEGDHANAIGTNQGRETVIAEVKMPRMTVRRLMPVETDVLMALPPNHTIPSFKPEDITDELVDKFIEIFYNWDMMNRKPKKQKDAPKDDDCDDDDADGETEEDASDDAVETSEEPADPKEAEKTDGLPPVRRRSRKVVRAWLERISNPKTCPDAPRYKADGNSFCANCIRWIGLSIQAVEDKYNGGNNERKQ